MGLFDLFGISGAVAPMSSFFEMVKSLRGNREDKKTTVIGIKMTKDNIK